MVIRRNPQTQPVTSHPDPGPGSSTSAFVGEYSPYLIPTYEKPPPVFTHGAGSWLVDMEGRRYLDFCTGFSVNSLGVADPQIAAILADQAGILLQSSSGYHNKYQGPLAKLLVDKTREAGCMPGVAAAAFLNSGTEAVEAALKYARRWGLSQDPSGNKTEILYYTHAYHGVTFGAGSASPGRMEQFSPLVPGFIMVPYNHLSTVEKITERTCGVIIEPIQGQGGVSVATDEFLIAIAKRCSEKGAVLIHDEVQSGLSRSGDLWAHAVLPPSAHPDILVFAKAIGNGFPTGGVLVTSTVLDTIHVLDTGSTLGGNPIACRIGYHILERLSDPALLAGVRAKSKVCVTRLREMQEKYPGKIKEVRGRGLLLGVEMTGDPTPVVDAARIRGLLVVGSGLNTIRLLPALNIDDEDVRKGMDIFEAAVAETAL